MQKFYIDEAGKLAGSYDGPDDTNPYAELSSTEIVPIDRGQIWNGSAWAFPLDLIKERRKVEVAARFEAALAAGMAWAGKTLQMRPEDQVNFTAMGNEARWAEAVGAAWPDNFAWRMADDSFLPLATAAECIDMAVAAKNEVIRLRVVSWAHKDAIEALATVEAVEAYDIETGWVL